MPILAAEIGALVAAGATLIQVDEPSPAIHPDAPADFAALFNAAVAPAVGVPTVRLAAHLCFGNYLGRPLARRTFRPVMDQLRQFRVAELVLEFANREMTELDVLPELAAAGFDLAVGVVDVKSYYLETPDDVAARGELVLGPAFRRNGSRSCRTAGSARRPAGRRERSWRRSWPVATSCSAGSAEESGAEAGRRGPVARGRVPSPRGVLRGAAALPYPPRASPGARTRNVADHATRSAGARTRARPAAIADARSSSGEVVGSRACCARGTSGAAGQPPSSSQIPRFGAIGAYQLSSRRAPSGCAAAATPGSPSPPAPSQPPYSSQPP